MKSYKERIYERYFSDYLGHSRGRVDARMLDRLSQTYDAWFSPYLPSDLSAPILDIGCGYGNLLYWAAKRGHTAISGIDLSQEQIDLAAQLCPAAELTCTSWRAHLHGRHAHYALIACIDVVEHMTKDELFEFLDAAREALQPGGMLLLQTINGEGITAAAYIYGDLTHETILTPVSAKTALRVCGFENVACKPTLPVAKNVKGAIRLALWTAISEGRAMLNLIEVGHRGSRIVTRNMIVAAERPM